MYYVRNEAEGATPVSVNQTNNSFTMPAGDHAEIDRANGNVKLSGTSTVKIEVPKGHKTVKIKQNKKTSEASAGKPASVDLNAGEAQVGEDKFADDKAE